MKKQKKIKAEKKTAVKEITEMAGFLTLLCAGQKIVLPNDDTKSLRNGTGKIFDSYRPYNEEMKPIKIIGFNNCVHQNRDKIFSSFGSKFTFKNLKMSLYTKKKEKGGTYRVIEFIGKVPDGIKE